MDDEQLFPVVFSPPSRYTLLSWGLSLRISLSPGPLPPRCIPTVLFPPLLAANRRPPQREGVLASPLPLFGLPFFLFG